MSHGGKPLRGFPTLRKYRHQGGQRFSCPLAFLQMTDSGRSESSVTGVDRSNVADGHIIEKGGPKLVDDALGQ